MTASATHSFLPQTPLRALAGFGLALTLCLPLSLGGAPAAAAAETSATASPVQAGVVEAITALSHRVERQSQTVIDEKALEYARRADAADEQRRLEALNARGQSAAEKQQASAAAAAASDKEAARPSSQTPASETIDDGATPLASGTKAPADSAKASSKKAAKRTSTLFFRDVYVPFIQGSPDDITAPALTASTWGGTGDVNDDQNTYFIGHNPGVFNEVMNLQIGDEITVWDASGKKRTYYVFDTLTLPNASNYYTYEARIAPLGETITLQTCCADNKNVRCVMAR